MKLLRFLIAILLVPLAFTASCSQQKSEPIAAAKPPKHEHHPPHGGTPVVLGYEVYHIEFVRDADAGKLQAYVFDGELENFIHASMPSFEIDVIVNGTPQPLVLNAVANPATGETVGDTSLFEAQADWLKTTKDFDATLESITIRSSTFTGVKFNFPKGNDTD